MEIASSTPVCDPSTKKPHRGLQDPRSCLLHAVQPPKGRKTIPVVAFSTIRSADLHINAISSTLSVGLSPALQERSRLRWRQWRPLNAGNLQNNRRREAAVELAPDNEGSVVGMSVGIALGVAVAVALLIGLVVVVRRKKNAAAIRRDEEMKDWQRLCESLADDEEAPEVDMRMGDLTL